MLFLCLANEPLESDTSAVEGEAPMVVFAEQTPATEGKLLIILTYYFYTDIWTWLYVSYIALSGDKWS